MDSEVNVVRWDMSVARDGTEGHCWHASAASGSPFEGLVGHGTAPTEGGAVEAAESFAKFCTAEVGRLHGASTGVTFHPVFKLFPDQPVGGGLTIGRLAPGAALDPLPVDLQPIGDLAFDWQTRGGRQTFLTAAGGECGGRLRELFGCMGAVGEQVMLACATANELSLVLLEPNDPGGEIRRRAWAEQVGHWLMAAGHLLFNTVGRLVALDPQVRPYLESGSTEALTSHCSGCGRNTRKALRTSFPVESDAFDDWLTLNKQNANLLVRAAENSSAAELADAARLMHRLVTSCEWRQMAGGRGETFHRWRRQTAGVSTATRKMARLVEDNGRLPDGRTHDVEAADTADTMSAAVLASLRRIAKVMAEFDSFLAAAMSKLTTASLDNGLIRVRNPNLSLWEDAPGTGFFLIVSHRPYERQIPA